MATVPYTIHKTANPIVWVVEWANLATGDTAVAFDVSTVPGAGSADRSVQAVGTFGGATVILEGSNDRTTFAPLQDVEGTAISFTSAGLVQVLEYTRSMRPAISGGTADAVDVYLLVKGSR